jgi:hypothetical protein
MSVFIKHFLSINDFRILLTQAYTQSPMRLLGFIPEYVGEKTTQLTFRTLCWNSEAILAELLKRGEAELATDAFTSHNYLFLHTMPLNHNFLQIGRPISDPLGQASGIQLSHRPSGQ